MEIKIEETTKKSTVVFSENDEKPQQPSAKLTSSVNAASSKCIDDIPIISISDGEDAVGQHKPTTVQMISCKRNSVDAAEAENDQHLILKRPKIKEVGAPKTHFSSYMNDRQELLHQELPTKIAIEHTKNIGGEWQKMIENKKATDRDKQR
ncbi:PREDICTED: uncharacterized protein LOC108373004 isoform X1 [Rhagoletis zephyria]|uniref:uncharacterized protein LOC108373004 isoform X1 n=1 Tax=Rhagoletis zephyria TaxID=28612 RepID=UPI0008119CDF|nr:PREDICTED: uncharacterized protein LOC108373004 isoform X1 [Rhagoletis zephyria]